MTKAIPHSTPPTKITIRGPYLSTNHPSIGTSHVSNRTNSVNATWIDARSQPNFFWMSGTKNVQPYCRLAIITMQMTPMMSCTHGDAKNDLGSGRCWAVASTGSSSVIDPRRGLLPLCSLFCRLPHYGLSGLFVSILYNVFGISDKVNYHNAKDAQHVAPSISCLCVRL